MLLLELSASLEEELLASGSLEELSTSLEEELGALEEELPAELVGASLLLQPNNKATTTSSAKQRAHTGRIDFCFIVLDPFPMHRIKEAFFTFTLP